MHFISGDRAELQGNGRVFKCFSVENSWQVSRWHYTFRNSYCFSHPDSIDPVGIAALFFVKCVYSFKVAEKKRHLNTRAGSERPRMHLFTINTPLSSGKVPKIQEPSGSLNIWNWHPFRYFCDVVSVFLVVFFRFLHSKYIDSYSEMFRLASYLLHFWEAAGLITS